MKIENLFYWSIKLKKKGLRNNKSPTSLRYGLEIGSKGVEAEEDMVEEEERPEADKPWYRRVGEEEASSVSHPSPVRGSRFWRPNLVGKISWPNRGSKGRKTVKWENQITIKVITQELESLPSIWSDTNVIGETKKKHAWDPLNPLHTQELKSLPPIWLNTNVIGETKKKHVWDPLNPLHLSRKLNFFIHVSCRILSLDPLNLYLICEYLVYCIVLYIV